MKSLCFALALMLCQHATAEVRVMSVASVASVPQGSQIQLAMLAHTNAIRLAANKPPQTLDDRLCRAAQEQADYLARTGTFDHYVNGNPRRRAAKHGFPVRDENDIAAVQENIAGGFSTPANAFHGWTNSSGHYAAILADRPLCGFGVASDRSRWVALYGRESAASDVPAQEIDPYDLSPRRYVRQEEKPADVPGHVWQKGEDHTRLAGFWILRKLRDVPAAPAKVAAQCGPAGCGQIAVRRQSAQSPKQNVRQSRRGGWYPGKFLGR